MKRQLIILFILIAAWINTTEPIQNQLLMANQFYQDGINAATLLDQQKAFNQSLKHYLSLEKLHSDSPLLDQAIAENLFQLQEYSWSIYYSYKALKNSADDTDIHKRILKAQKKLGIPSGVYFSTQDNWLSLNQSFKLGDRYQLFFWLMLLTFTLISFTLLFSHPFFIFLRNIFFALSSALLFNLIFSYFIIPNEAIVIHTSPLYRSSLLDLQTQLPFVVKEGEKIRVLDVQKGSQAIKIESAGGIGYMLISSIVIL
jgi:hypothetical protein